ncbi:MAG: efflux RND transporter permease subunit [Bacteroidales bacterium]|jgi:HAE1 family hydrophobic/amphiphilic exporter-1|nr:efflux RND transporter permease subunit [Bacteroidales bacterium]
MSIYKTSINKPITTALIFVAVIIIGVFSLTKLPIDQFPEMEPPYITVLTTYPGASASEVETNVTKLLENSLNSVDGLKSLTSESKDNMSMVLLELEWGTNMDEVINDVRSFIDMIKDNLPSGSSNPFIFKFSSSSMPIIQYAITAKESYSGLDKILNDEVIPLLNKVDGIGNLSLSGSPERFVYIDIDQEKLDAYKIPLETVGNAVSSNNLNLSSGTVKMDKEQYQMEVRSEYVESNEINNIVVTTTADGKRVFVKDIATVKDTIKDLTLDEKINGREGVRLIISKQTGANTVQICHDVQQEMSEIKKTLPADVQVDVIYDSSENIENAISSLEESILYALLFVVLVILFFLGRWRATIIISLTIPIALIAAFIYLKFIGSSLNIISLCSLTIAIGMVVDDAIVVLENITRHIDRGSAPREAAIYATNEVWISVIATTLVIVAVFVPLTMLTGMAGIMFKELGWIVTITVCVSTVVAITLTPMLSAYLMKARNQKVRKNGQIVDVGAKKTWYDRNVVRLLDRVDVFYANALRFCLHHKAITLVVALLIFGVSLIPIITGQIGTDFMQQSDNGRLSVSIELQRGTRIEETMKTARMLEQRFEALVPEIRLISTTAGSNDDAGVSAIFNSTTNNKISMTVVCNKRYERKRTIFEIAEILRNEMKKYPEIITYQANASQGFGGGGASTVDVEIYGYDFDQTNILADQIKRSIQDSVKGARDVIIDRDEDRAELKIVVDKEKLALHGLTSSVVSAYMRNRVNGMTVGYLKEDGDEYDIVVRLQEENRNSLTEIENMSIPVVTPKGVDKIKLKEIASIEEYWSPPNISRKSRQRIVRVQVTPYQTSLGELAVGVEKTLSGVDIPQGISIRLGGNYEDQQETFGDMGLLLALIVLLVYIVMASQFESFSKPFIIMMAVPFAFTGVILALFITHTTLDMIGALGAIMLVGIVVKNGIVLVDYINLMRDRGYELNEAIALSGKSRLRPVLMTALTTILGMVPMALATSEGSEMWVPMGVVVIGGLLVSTVVTLIVVPVLYAVMSRRGERDKVEKVNRRFVFMDTSLPQDADTPK